MKEYLSHFSGQRIQEHVTKLLDQNASEERESVDLNGIRLRGVVLKQDQVAQEYFKNFFLLFLQYLYAIGETSE